MLAVLLLLLVGASGYVVGARKDRPAVARVPRQTVVAPTQPPVASISPYLYNYERSTHILNGPGSKAGWRTHKDAIFRYSIEYPDNWHLENFTLYTPIGPDSVRLKHNLEIGTPGRGDIIGGMIKITEWDDPECTKDREEFLNRSPQEEPSLTPVTVNGVNGLKFDRGSFFIRDNRCYVITYWCGTICDQAFSTFKFID